MVTDDIKETADAVGEAAGIIERGVEAVAEQIAELAATYGELAWETTLTIVRIEAAGQVALGFLLLTIAAICAVVSYRSGRMAFMDESIDEGSSIPLAGLCVVTAVGTVPSTVESLIRLFDVWNWVALFAPELYLAKRALDAVVSL